MIKFQPGIEDVELRRIAIFDTSVAHAHLAEQSPIGFTPIGFDVFAEIIRVYGEINNKLNASDPGAAEGEHLHEQLSGTSKPHL